MRSSRKAIAILLVLGLQTIFLQAQAAPVYPPVVGGCNKATFSNIVINTPNVTVSRIKLEDKNTKVITTKVNRANTFLLSGIKVGKVVSINLTLPDKKNLALKPSVVSTGGLLCPTNVTFTKAGEYRFVFKTGSVSRSVLYRVTR